MSSSTESVTRWLREQAAEWGKLVRLIVELDEPDMLQLTDHARHAAHFARVADLLERTGCQNLDELEAKHDALRLGLEEALDMIPPCEHAHCADDKERFRKLIGG